MDGWMDGPKGGRLAPLFGGVISGRVIRCGYVGGPGE